MAPQGQGMLWSEILCCPLCSQLFSARHLPINLACGHALCKPCLEGDKAATCPYDETVMSMPVNKYPVNVALLKILKVEIPRHPNTVRDRENIAPLEDLLCRISSYLSRADSERGGSVYSEHLSRPVQRKLVFLLSFQLLEREGRLRAMKSCRSIADRILTEIVMSYQSPAHTCTMLWSAVRARGCQFLGPAMQEDVLRLILLTLSKGEHIARKTLVLYIVQTLSDDYPQVSKTCVGHVVQLLYRASCFNVFKRDGESSLMQLKEEFRDYDALRREHDAQIVQIAVEAGLRISPDQWSSLLYGDAHYRSHMQSIIDKQHASHGHTFLYPLTELDDIVDLHPGDAGILNGMRENFAALESLDSAIHDPPWEMLEYAFSSLRDLIDRHVIFMRKRTAERANGTSFHGRREREDYAKAQPSPQTRKYKTQACKIVMSGKPCPRGDRCNFAHDVLELREQDAPESNSRRPSQQPPPATMGAAQPQRNYSASSSGPGGSSAVAQPLSSFTPPHHNNNANNRPPADPIHMQPAHVQPVPKQTLHSRPPLPQPLLPPTAHAPAVVPIVPLLIPGAQGLPELMPTPVIPPVPMVTEPLRDGVLSQPQPPFVMIAPQPAPQTVVGPLWPTAAQAHHHQMQGPSTVTIRQVVPVIAGPPPNAPPQAWMQPCNASPFPIARNPPGCPPPLGVVHPSNGSVPFRYEGSDGVTYFEDSFNQTFPAGPIPVAPAFMPRYSYVQQSQPAAPYCVERISEVPQSTSNSSSSKSHWESSEEQLHIRRSVIMTHLGKSGLSYSNIYDDAGDGDDEDSKQHVSYTVANAVFDEEKDGHNGAISKNLELPPIPLRYNSLMTTTTAQSLTQVANSYVTIPAPSSVRTMCPTTFVRGVTAPPATVQADCSRMKVKDTINQPLPTPMIQYFQMQPVHGVLDPGHLAERLPAVIRPLTPTPSDPQNVVSSTIDKIVDVRERIHDVHMNGGLTSAAEKQQLDVELNIVSRGIQSLDRQTKQVCLLKELKAVDERIENFNINA